jgi:hypothetical protein
MIDGTDMAPYAAAIAAGMYEYAEGYIEMANEEPAEFEQHVLRTLREVASGYKPSVGDAGVFATMVKYNIEFTED